MDKVMTQIFNVVYGILFYVLISFGILLYTIKMSIKDIFMFYVQPLMVNTVYMHLVGKRYE